MLFTSKENLEDTIIRRLVEKERTARELLGFVDGYTIQALYVVLRKLIAAEVILKRGTRYFLSEEWRSKVITQLEYQAAGGLSEGESVTYNLSSLVHHDVQWKNVVLPLHMEHPHDPIFFYSYHYIWVLLSEGRRQSEIAYFSSLKDRKNHTFSLTGGESKRDVEVKRLLQNEYVQWAVGVEYFSKTDYLTVFSDYIITTRLTNQLADEIERCYEQSATLETLEEELQKVGVAKQKIKLSVERNKAKAKKLRKRLSKEFFVSRQLVEDFQLY